MVSVRAAGLSHVFGAVVVMVGVPRIRLVHVE